MIRLKLLRLDYSEDPEYGSGPHRKGLIWYEYGQPVGRVIIEEYHRIVNSAGNDEGYEWIPVEMVEVDPISEFKDKAKKLA
jgi:hypothetical protein